MFPACEVPSEAGGASDSLGLLWGETRLLCIFSVSLRWLVEWGCTACRRNGGGGSSLKDSEGESIGQFLGRLMFLIWAAAMTAEVPNGVKADPEGFVDAVMVDR